MFSDINEIKKIETDEEKKNDNELKKNDDFHFDIDPFDFVKKIDSDEDKKFLPENLINSICERKIDNEINEINNNNNLDEDKNKIIHHSRRPSKGSKFAILGKKKL